MKLRFMKPGLMTFSLIVSTVLILSLHGCGEFFPGFGSIPVHIKWKDSPNNRTEFQGPDEICDKDVKTVLAQVYPENSDTPIRSDAWPCDSHQMVIRHVPAGTYTVVVMASDNSDELTYHYSEQGITVPAGGAANPVEATLNGFMPALAPPCDGITLNWCAVPDAASYEITISENKDMDDGTAFSEPDTSFSPSGLNKGEVYFWHVKAIDAFGNNSRNSEIGQFVAGSTSYLFDIGTGTKDSFPSEMITINDVLYFSAEDSSGYHLWRYDGELFSKIETGASENTHLHMLIEFNGQLFFILRENDIRDEELWRYNGSEAIKIDMDDTGSSSPAQLIVYKNNLYFVATVGQDRELYRYNGVDASPEKIDILNGESSSPTNLVVDNGFLYFCAMDSSTHRDLFRYDGTSVTDLNIKNVSIDSARFFTESNNLLYFTATADDGDNELYRYDGVDPTPLKIDVCAGTYSSYPRELTDLSGHLYFSARDEQSDTELFMYPGTGSVATKININTSGGSYPSRLVASDGTLYFSAIWEDIGAEPSYYDETNLQPLADIRAGKNGSHASGFTEMNGIIYFSADSGPGKGTELWSFNKTTGETQLVEDICPGTCSGDPSHFTSVNFKGVPTLFFRATNGNDGYELWSTSSSGTAMVYDINISGGGPIPKYLTNVNGKLYFRANDGSTGNELWESDGTIAGTRMTIDLIPGPESSNPSDIAGFGGNLYFQALNDELNSVLWKYNGAAASQIQGNNYTINNPSQLTIVGDALYFAAGDRSEYKIWTYDGTAADPIDTTPYHFTQRQPLLTNAYDTLYFIANDSTDNKELYKYSDNILTQLKVNTSGSSEPYGITAIGGDIYFGATDETASGQDTELYKYNGTTLSKIDINPNGSSRPYSPVEMGGDLYCLALGHLYKINGASPTKIDGANMRYRIPTKLVSVNNTLLFLTTESDGPPASPHELWRSDGTTQGTYRVMELDIPAYLYCEDAVESNGKVFFLMIDMEFIQTGWYAIWATDGTEENTMMLANFHGPNWQLYRPEIERTDDAFFFTHYDSQYGMELWKHCP